MKPLYEDEALRIANQMILFGKLYIHIQQGLGFLPQEAYLMAVAAVEAQTGEFLPSVPRPATHRWEVKLSPTPPETDNAHRQP